MVEKLIVITVLITAASLLDVELLILHMRHALLLRKKRRRDLYWAKRQGEAAREMTWKSKL